MSFNVRNLGLGVRRLREEHGLHAKELAAAAGISASYLSDIENGRRPISVTTLHKLARHFELPDQILEENLKRLAGFGESSHPGKLPDETAVVSPPAPEGGEATVPYYSRSPQTTPSTPPPSTQQDDVCDLARWFVSSLDREKAFDLVHQMTDKARQGDAKAAGIARALLLILSSP